MNCPSCGHENREDATFCGECAAALAREQRCSSCGRSNPAGQKFCDGCAHPLGSAAAAAAQRDPRAYTPKHLADKILRSKSALEGERKQVTVLFADVKGSMELAEQLDPEVWHTILERFFQILSDGVHRFEGTVNQYTGDGIMALFGAPIAHEDHAQRTCYAALHLRDELRRYANEVRVAHGLSFAVRMGINSGEVVVGKIGDDLRMDYTAQGHTVGLAARMQELAEPGIPCLTENAAELVRGYFELEDLGQTAVKGSHDPVQIFALSGLGTVRTRLDLSRTRGFSRFVGRANEMQTLEAALERALEGQGQVVGIVAEAGMGKSRLCFEFTERCRLREIPVRAVTGVPHGKAVPFLPILDFYRQGFGIEPGDEPVIVRQKVAGGLVLLDEELRDSVPLMLEFLGVPAPANPGPILDPEERQRRLVALLQRITLARSELQPAVLLFEDLHWFDTGSEALLEALIDTLSGTRTLLIANYRLEYRGSWIHRSHVQQLALQPLSAEALSELLGDLLGTDASVAELHPRILERTGGNPFFIEELIRALAEQGVLEGSRGDYRLAKRPDQVRLPATVTNVLAARIDRLAEEQKLLLQTASVIGPDFAESLLARVAGQPAEALAAGLSSLVQSEFLLERALYPEREYQFKHALTRDVAYDSQLQSRRRQLHAAVAKALEEVHGDNLDEKAALLARHWEDAGEPLAAARWYRRSAEWLGLGNLRESAQHWAQVRDLCDPLPASPEVDELGLVARIQLVQQGARLGFSEAEMEQLYREADARVERSGDSGARAVLENAYRLFRVVTSPDPSEHYAAIARAVELADESGDVVARVISRYTAAANSFVSGHPEVALRIGDELLELLAEDPTVGEAEIGTPPIAAALYFRAVSLVELERHAEAAPVVERLRRQAREGDHASVAFYAANAESALALGLGDAQRALSACAEALDGSVRSGNLAFSTAAGSFMVQAQVLNGHWADAISVGEGALEVTRESRTALFVALPLLAALAEAYLGAGDAEAARSHALEAIAAAEQQGSGMHAPRLSARLALARARLRIEGPVPAVEEELSRAEELGRESGKRGSAARVEEARAELAAARGDDAGRAAHLREAQRIYSEIGATGHAARVAREPGL